MFYFLYIVIVNPLGAVEYITSHLILIYIRTKNN